MNFDFIYNLEVNKKAEFIAFYRSVDHVTIEQHASWVETTDPEKKYCKFIATEKEKTVCTAIIEESKQFIIKTANIQFGPLFLDNDVLIICIQKISEFYKKKGFSVLSIQLAIPTGASADYIEYKLNKITKPRYSFDRNNWSSIVIDLALSEDELLRNMSKGHKSDIKKAYKSELSILNDFSSQQFNDFIAVYKKMHKERGLAENKQGSSVYLNNILTFFKTFDAGRFLLVADNTNKIIGGIALVYQNKTVRYFKGAADPEVKNLPVLHLAIWEAIKKSKEDGFNCFDLWGYNHFVDENDQVFFINRFKKGFGGTYSFYPKKIYYVFKPIFYQLLMNAQKIYKKLK